MQALVVAPQGLGQFGRSRPAIGRGLADAAANVLAQDVARELGLPVARQRPIEIPHGDLVEGQAEAVDVALGRGLAAMPHFGGDVVPRPHHAVAAGSRKCS